MNQIGLQLEKKSPVCMNYDYDDLKFGFSCTGSHDAAVYYLQRTTIKLKYEQASP